MLIKNLFWVSYLHHTEKNVNCKICCVGWFICITLNLVVNNNHYNYPTLIYSHLVLNIVLFFTEYFTHLCYIIAVSCNSQQPKYAEKTATYSKWKLDHISAVSYNIKFVNLKTGIKARFIEYFPSFVPNTHKLYILIHCINIVFILQKIT